MEHLITKQPDTELAAWWDALEEQWKRAYNEVFFKKEAIYQPSEEELKRLKAIPVLRLAGPRASYPSISFELTNLSGVVGLKNLVLLVAINHQLKHVDEVASLTNLKSLFVHDNQIEQIRGVKDLVNLEECYCQKNNIVSLEPLEKLTKLKTVYCYHNQLSTLKGLTEEHADELGQFFCLPNSGLSNKEVVKTERDLYIKCRKA